MMLIKNLIPIRDFKLAFACATLLMLLFWVTGYPVDEWAAAVAVLYVSIWLSCEVVVGLAAYAARLLAGYGKRILQKYDITVAEQSIAEPGHRKAWPVRGAILAVFTFAFGVALTAGFFVMDLLDLTPLAAYLQWSAWGLFALGITGLSLAFGVPAFVFVMADARRKDFDTKIARVHAITDGLAHVQGWRVAH